MTMTVVRVYLEVRGAERTGTCGYCRLPVSIDGFPTALGSWVGVYNQLNGTVSAPYHDKCTKKYIEGLI